MTAKRNLQNLGLSHSDGRESRTIEPSLQLLRRVEYFLQDIHTDNYSLEDIKKLIDILWPYRNKSFLELEEILGKKRNTSKRIKEIKIDEFLKDKDITYLRDKKLMASLSNYELAAIANKVLRLPIYQLMKMSRKDAEDRIAKVLDNIDILDDIAKHASEGR
jgi:hypothetical protein